jgi:hypothetical protein
VHRYIRIPVFVVASPLLLAGLLFVVALYATLAIAEVIVAALENRKPEWPWDERYRPHS